jgi:AraC family transcriptional regulator
MEARMARVLHHIFDHPDGDLSLDALADVAALSRFHFHRSFHGMTGETAAQAVRRIRVHRASWWLVQTDWSVDEIAVRSGYDNTESFVRVFKSQYGLTPLAFRAKGQAEGLIPNFQKGHSAMFPVEIRDNEDAIRLAALPHKGSYFGIGRVFEQLSAMFTARGLWPQAKGMIGVYYDDPDAVAEADLSSHAGIAIDPEMPLPEGTEEISFPQRRYAVLTFVGPYAGLRAAYQWFYGTWLPGSGETPADAPCFELYMNSPQDTAPDALETRIFMPLT